MEVTGILHAHSTYSYDAKLSLREIKELCKKNNVQFVCMTEHVDEMTNEDAQKFVAECEVLSDESFLFIPGFEVPYPPSKKGDHAHVLMISQRGFFGNYAPNIETLMKWTTGSGFVVLAHPVRNQFIVDDGLLASIDALEIWNQQYEGKRVPRTRSLTLLDELRSRKPGLLATGGVDFHRKEHFGAPFVTMNVETLSELAILEKLNIGAYTVASEKVRFFGTIPNIAEIKKAHRVESFVSVSIINLGKFVNKVLASCGISLPKSLKQRIRRRL